MDNSTFPTPDVSSLVGYWETASGTGVPTPFTNQFPPTVYVQKNWIAQTAGKTEAFISDAATGGRVGYLNVGQVWLHDPNTQQVMSVPQILVSTDSVTEPANAQTGLPSQIIGYATNIDENRLMVSSTSSNAVDYWRRLNVTQ
jgi:hypothetical protein